MKLFRKIFAIGTLIAVMSNSGTIAYASESQQAVAIENVSLQEAENVVIMHVQGVMAMDDESPWNEGVRIKNRKALFDVDEEISAYYFGLVNRNEEPCGYVITGADTAGYPLIEYSDTGESFINESIERTSGKVDEKYNIKVKDKLSKVYYLGDTSYAVEHTLQDNTKVMYDVTSSQVCEIDKEEVKEQKSKQSKDKKSDADYSSVWESYEDIAYQGGSNPPDSNYQFITLPASYESGYTKSCYYDVTGANMSYEVMTNFSNGGVCSPTAATNLCKYWYRRNPSKYMNLFKNCSWDDVFWSFFEYMGTDEEKGTMRWDIVRGYTRYFNEVGVSYKCSYYIGTNGGRDVVAELKNDRPCHLAMVNHARYNNHCVLALGYAVYEYSNGADSIYIRIADGWTSYPNRYVWGGCHGSWEMITVIPN